MNSICFFASYFKGKNLPYYITVYLKELKRHFGEVILLMSQKELSESSIAFLKDENIGINLEENDGFDFGLWYKAFQKYRITNYDQVALVNDSCILFKPLDAFMKWSALNDADMKGMTRSEAISPHLQSYFLIIQKTALPSVSKYFNEHKVYKNISEVILNYEVGLSNRLISEGYKIEPFIDNNGYAGEFSPYYYCLGYHLQKGIPLIKKKILYSSYRKDELFTLARMNFNIDRSYYIALIKHSNSNLILDFDVLLNDAESQMSRYQVLKYKITCKWIKLLRPLYGRLKK